MEGWNDPPKNVGMPTGNLKISLNKRVAFPLSSIAASQSTSQSACPLLLPPKPPSATSEPSIKNDEPSNSSAEDVSTQKDQVLKVLRAGVEALSASVQSSTASKLKTLEDDWSQCDIEIQRLLVELTKYLEDKDAKTAAATQRKIVMKGCSKQWVHAIRQIIMNLETVNAEVVDFQQAEVVDSNKVDVTGSSEGSETKTDWI